MGWCVVVEAEGEDRDGAGDGRAVRISRVGLRVGSGVGTKSAFSVGTLDILSCLAGLVGASPGVGRKVGCVVGLEVLAVVMNVGMRVGSSVSGS